MQVSILYIRILSHKQVTESHLFWYVKKLTFPNLLYIAYEDWIPSQFKKETYSVKETITEQDIFGICIVKIYIRYILYDEAIQWY